MMGHLESSFTGKNNFWRYFILSVIVFLAIQTIGGIPLYIYMAKDIIANPDSVNNISVGDYDFGPYGLEMNLFPFIIGLIAFWVFMKPVHQRSFGSVINGGKRFRWNQFFASYFVWVALAAIYLAVSMKVFPDNFRLNNLSNTLIRLVLVSLFIIPFQAGFEEVLLRGYFMQGFAVATRRRWAPLVITSVLFGLMHSFNPEVEAYGFFTAMPQYIIFGLIFGIMTLLSDGLEIPIGAHAANNAFLCIMVTNKDSALQTPAVFEQTAINPWTEFVFMLVMGSLALAILGRLFDWNWSILKRRVESGKSEQI